VRTVIIIVIGLIIASRIYSGSPVDTPDSSRALRTSANAIVTPTVTSESYFDQYIKPTATALPALHITRAGCDPAYPEARTCIPLGPPYSQGCAITTQRLFTVLAPDPQHLDADGDGVGCEPVAGSLKQAPSVAVAPQRTCESSYPDVCIPPTPPDLSCDDVAYMWGYEDFIVYPPDTHGFDGDGDGRGCEPYSGQSPPKPNYEAYLEEQARQAEQDERDYQDYLDEQESRDDYHEDMEEPMDYCEAHRCVE
jgi:hypothetical protein